MDEIKIKCFEVVSTVVEEATRQFSPIWCIDLDKYATLEQYCRAIDAIAEEFNGESIDIEIDEIKMTVSITVECWDMKLESISHVFYKLAKRSVKFGFSVSEEGNLNVNFTFPSVWKRS